jgi:hypothetical protein
MSLEQWAAEYVRALPSMIRPDMDDHRFANAARAAVRNGWVPKQLAKVVQERNYANATNPVLLALIRLEDYAARAPHVRAVSYVGGSGCLVCGKTPCPAPITDRSAYIPAAWASERVGLLVELTRIPDMSDDERQHCMSVLIADQKRRTQPV